MPNVFTAAAAKSSAAVARLMGERIAHIPWKAGGDFTAGGPDPGRPAPAEPFRAILSGALGSMNSSGDRADNFRATVLTRDRQLTVDAPDMPAGILEGDHFKALDQPGEPEFEAVAAPVWDGMSRWFVYLVAFTPGESP